MGRFRDAITGWFTTKEHALANPDTTIRESIRIRDDGGPTPISCANMTFAVRMPCGCPLSLTSDFDARAGNGAELAALVDRLASRVRYEAVVRFKDHRCPRNGL